jgi:hypothetical protein
MAVSKVCVTSGAAAGLRGMTVGEFNRLDEQEAMAVIRWRFARLARSGYGVEEAITLATHVDVDLHRATELVARGCPPSLALRILL